MSNRMMLKFAIGAWALTQACVSAQAACTTPVPNITVAVSPAVTNTFSDIVSDFQLANSVTYTTTCYTVTLISAPAASIAGTVVAAGAANGNSASAYDLLFTESPLVPFQLAGLYPKDVVGSPIWTARDVLDLYSVGADVSSGLPLFPAAFSVPNPSTLDPYGVATVTVLKGGWPRALAKNLAILTDDSVSSWAAAEYALPGSPPAYGFTGKSQICTNVTGQEIYQDGSSHYEYLLGRDYLTPIDWTGLKLQRLSNGNVVSRSAGEEAAVTAFINFLSQAGVTVTDPNTHQSISLNGGKTDLAQHCLKTTR